MRSSPLLRKIGPAVKRSRSGHYASLRQTWLYRLQAFTGAAPQRGRRSVEAFEASGGTCGYRRIAAVAGAGDRAVRGIMRDEGLVARAAKKKQRYGSYEGEVSEAPRTCCATRRASIASGSTGPTSCGSPT